MSLKIINPSMYANTFTQHGYRNLSMYILLISRMPERVLLSLEISFATHLMLGSSRASRLIQYQFFCIEVKIEALLHMAKGSFSCGNQCLQQTAASHWLKNAVKPWETEKIAPEKLVFLFFLVSRKIKYNWKIHVSSLNFYLKK